MINDRKITISSAGSRKAENWPAQETCIGDLWERLRQPVRGTESQAEYLAMKKPRQDDLKDVGGFVAGSLRGGRRKSDCVEGRDVVTLDLDRIAPGGTQDVLRRVDGLGCGYCVYSTRKHRPEAPRLRVLLPLDRTVTADEYEPVARKAAEILDPSMEPFDPTTFQAARLMYWPSCSADAEYIYQCADKPLLSADGVLQLYGDWRDVAQWPQVPGAQQAHVKLAAKQGDPLEKPGIVGAFCRCYDVYAALETFLPGVYEPAGQPDRYTYTGGSTTGGAVVYDNGAYLYSHHATDPAGGRLCNAFDLVRLHRFGAQDEDAKPDTPVNKLPSFLAMRRLAVADLNVLAHLDQARQQQAAADFADLAEDGGTENAVNWRVQLTRDGNGNPENTIDNAWVILENDPLLKDKFALNRFSSRGEVFGQLPWSDRTDRRAWEDNDNAGVYWYLEKYYRITASKKVDSALSLHSRRHAFNEVQDYISGLQWDGTPRLDRLFIDYLGVADTPYTRAVTRKAFTAAVARAMTPGCKFDQMTVISGPQGIGKSTLLRKMGRRWFSDSVRDFSHIKETAELLQGVWIVEVGELGAMRNTDINKVKQLMSQQIDRFRAAYARSVEDCPRCCVFFGTSNDRDYLRDKTGNRRFWPLDAMAQNPIKSVFCDLDAEVDQLWAEAKAQWQMGEPLYLDPETEAMAKREQDEHQESSPWQGAVQEFLQREVPVDWNRRSMRERCMYWDGGAAPEKTETVPRDRVCAQEIWCEALDSNLKYMKRSDTIEINGIIEQMPGWGRAGKPLRFGCYGLQKGFIRKN